MKIAAALTAALTLALPAWAHRPPFNPVSPTKLESQVSLFRMMSGALRLQFYADKNGGHRAFGSPGHEKTVEYIYHTLKSLRYYDVMKQPFTETYAVGSGTLTIDDDEVASAVLIYSPTGNVTAPVIKVDGEGCKAVDYPTSALGQIALVERGACNFSTKVTLAKKAGAAAAIIYNNEPGSIKATLGAASDDHVPAVIISQDDGEALLTALARRRRTVTAQLVVDNVAKERLTYNVIAETKGGDHNNVLVVGGHSDSVPSGPGINDDGSGILGLLEVAIGLSRFKVNNAVRFAFWSAEEFGLLGSYHYVKSINSSAEELGKIRAYLNFDMIASPNYIFGIYDGDGNAFNVSGPPGSGVLERDFEDFFDRKGLNRVPTVFNGRSDYAAFIENGIPSGGLFTGAKGIKTAEEARLFGGRAGEPYDPNYHAAGDTIKNLNRKAFLMNTLSIANSVAKYATSFDSLPAVDKGRRGWSASRARFSRSPWSGRGPRRLWTGGEDRRLQ